jgi:hypothetical protein
VSVPQYGYPTIVASETFIHGTDNSIGNWTSIKLAGFDPNHNNWPPIELWNNTEAFEKMRANANNTTLYERMENQKCIEKYNDVYSKRGSLVVVTEDLVGDKNASVHQYIYWPAEYETWSRYNPCNIGDSHPGNPSCHDILSNTPAQYQAWQRFGRHVLYCLSERIDDHCQINYSPAIFIGM